MWSVPSSSFISSSSHPLIPVPSSVIAACAVFAARCYLSVFSSSLVVVRSPSSSRSVHHSVHRPVPRLVHRSVVSSSFRLSSRCRLVLSRRLVRSPRFSTRWAGRFLIRWRAGKQAEGGQTVCGGEVSGKAGRVRGVASMRWARVWQASRRGGRRVDMKSPRLSYETGRGVGVSVFSCGGEGVSLSPFPWFLAIGSRST